MLVRLHLVALILLLVGCDPPTVAKAGQNSDISTLKASTVTRPASLSLQVYARPEKPILTPEGEAFIFEFEGIDRHPNYPGGASGVTWGVGYDAHQNSKKNIALDWQKVPQVQWLIETQPYSGKSAREAAKQYKDITIPIDLSKNVFLSVDVSRTDNECRRAFPGFDDLCPYARDAIRSLVFNRGSAMNGPNRVEMRTIRDLVEKQDYEGMAHQEEKMIHLWIGTDIYAGMRHRRLGEAGLFRKCK